MKARIKCTVLLGVFVYTGIINMASAQTRIGLPGCKLENPSGEGCREGNSVIVYSQEEIDKKTNEYDRILNHHHERLKSITTLESKIEALETHKRDQEKNNEGSAKSLTSLSNRMNRFEESVLRAVSSLDQRLLNEEAFKAFREELRAIIKQEIANQMRESTSQGGNNK